MAEAETPEDDRPLPVIYDLESLIRQKLGDGVRLTDSVTSHLLKEGSYYGSTMVKIKALITNRSPPYRQRLNLVGKMAPSSKCEPNKNNITVSFKKEIFVYKELMPELRLLEKDLGVSQINLINILPTYYGSRLTLNLHNRNQADENVIILMENLCRHRTLKKLPGLDLEHAKAALVQLARFHALCMILIRKKPDFFRRAKKVLTPGHIVPCEEDHKNIDIALKTLFVDPRISRYESRIRKAVDGNTDWVSTVKAEEIPEQWRGIVHSDFWINNIMYLEEDEIIKDVKIVDFQFTRISSPMRDLPYFLFTSIQTKVIDKHVDELLNTYYNKFIEVLSMSNLFDMTFYNRRNFNHQMKKDAATELFYCLITAKVLIQRTNHGFMPLEEATGLMISDCTPEFMERAWVIVRTFVEKEWI